MLKLKLQLCHLLQNSTLFEMALDGKIEGDGRGATEDEMVDGIET